MTQLNLYVKSTSSCPGMPLETFNVTPGRTWTGDKLTMWFGTGAMRRECEVIGWTDLFFGSPCKVHVVKTTWQGPHDGHVHHGYLIYGGNSGVRISDPEHGERGMACVWVDASDAGDLPAEVLEVVG